MRRTWLLVPLVLPFLAGGSAGAQPAGGWLAYGNDLGRSSATATSLSAPSVRPAWYSPVSGRISSQALVAQDVPAPGRRTVYFATSKGIVYALGEKGYVRWRAELGQLDRICPQIDGYGVTGTPAIDADTGALYVADAFGRLHALDLATGEERAGWPVQLYADYRKELVWGALTIVNGSVYVGTGSYCDRTMVGKVIRVEIATRAMSRWEAVPRAFGGGGGVWGWGGIAYSARRGSLFVATGNAFRGGSNVGRRFREWAGYGEHLVELSPSLAVRSANHPPRIRKPIDLDFVGSPVIFRHAVCGELAGVLNKDGFIYVWRTAKVKAGTLFTLRLARRTLAAPLLSQPAYSPLTGALYVATPGRLVRIDVDRRCRGHVTWSKRVGSGLFNGSPTIAGQTVWLAENAVGGSALLGFDARSGRNRFRAALAGPTYIAPTVVGDRIYLGTYTGGVQGFALVSGLNRSVGYAETDLPEYRSFSDELRGWASREDGVYATEDGGRFWRLLYPRSAVRVARVSALTGMIALGDRASRCGCRQVRFWTADGGAHWYRTAEGVGNGFVGAAGTLWWWRGGRLNQAAAWPPGPKGLRRRFVTRVQGVIVDAKPVPGGIAALATRRVGGIGFDNSPRLHVVKGNEILIYSLPRVSGEVLVRSLEVAWPVVTVHASDVTGFTRGEEGTVTWTSPDGGGTWTVMRK